jgi:minor extracellular serine protease Vpr
MDDLMNSQKKENLLNLALDATEEERDKSPALNVGYDREDKRWEIIVKYNGDLEQIAASLPDAEIFLLSGGYAVIRVSESQIEPLAGFSQIEYMEKPKRLFFSVNKAKRDSCMPEAGKRIQRDTAGLSGSGVLVAVIDSGIDYFHGDFRDEDGKTRILELWDQQENVIYTQEQINRALESGSRSEALLQVPSQDVSGHGTAVAGIAAGNGLEGDGTYRGVAWQSDLLVVKLGTPLADSFPRTSELMRAIDYVVERGIFYKRPVAVNISFGNTYGSHDGTSLLETYLDAMAAAGKNSIIVGTGNEGSSMGHTSGMLQPGKPVEVEFSVDTYQTGFGVQLWKQYVDEFMLEVISPGGVSTGRIRPLLGSFRLTFPDTEMLYYYGMPSPYSIAQEIYFDLIPRFSYVESGIWKIRLIPEKIVSGKYDFWLPSHAVLNRGTRFLYAVPDTTLTIPSAARRAVSVGAYDDAYQTYADFSGRGYTRLNQSVKPELAAPGVNIVTARAGGGYEAVTGTSFAVPFVTGGAALLMEWGIVQGNDPYLYGEKLKACLMRGARPLPGERVYPNPRLGYGALCLLDSLP